MAQRPSSRPPSQQPGWPSLLVAIAIGFALSWYLLLRKPEAPRLTANAALETILLDPGVPDLGPQDADVALVVFTDYQCGVCRRLEPALRDLATEDPRLRIVFKDWPILGPESIAAARAALAAHRQGRYRAFHDALMAWPGRLDEGGIESAARLAGVDVARMRRDLRDHAAEIDATLAANGQQALGFGFRGTPGMLVGPYLLNGGVGLRDLRQLVAQARAEVDS